jgi:3-oxoacyl-[acyl-carrier protein] reductase
MRKTAIVTAGSRGIGRAIAKCLAEDGFAVVVNFTSSVHDAMETVAEITESGAHAVAIQADVTKQDDVKRLFDSSLKEFGRIDVVVNNAGIMPLSPIARGDVETFDETIRTNLRGTFLVFAQAASQISEGGRIIAFSSSALGKNSPSYGAYIASKAGVEGLVRVLANETRGRQVTVNAVALGPVANELSFEGKSEEEIARLGTLALPEYSSELNDIARVVSFIAGPEGGWINGQVIPVTDGAHDRFATVGSSAGPGTSSKSSVAGGPLVHTRA